MGRKEGSLTAAQILYPIMQCTDVFFLKADICQLGVDQRKVLIPLPCRCLYPSPDICQLGVDQRKVRAAARVRMAMRSRRPQRMLSRAPRRPSSPLVAPRAPLIAARRRPSPLIAAHRPCRAALAPRRIRAALAPHSRRIRAALAPHSRRIRAAQVNMLAREYCDKALLMVVCPLPRR